jgi:Domain of unknown function(DUF2779)
MSARVHTLSKSDFKLARSCATKLYYRELGYPDARDDDPYLEMLAEGGYMVEILAKQLFPDGETLAYGRDAQAAARLTMERLDTRGTVTLFEATLLDDRRLARVDILRRSPSGFDLYEVKSSSFDPEEADKRMAKTGSPFRNMTKGFEIAGKWREYLEDVTYQVTILRDLFPGVPVRPHLILMDKGKLAAHDGMPGWFRIVRREDGRLVTAEFLGDPELARRDPLTIGLDVSAEVAELEPGVRAAAEQFVASLVPEPRKLQEPIGGKCKACEFRVGPTEKRNGFLECWGARGATAPHVLDLYQGRDFREDLLAAGVDRIVDVSEAHFTGRTGAYAARQRIQVEQTRRGAEWFDPALGRAMSAAQWPLHFIDFEAARMAVPHHKGMPPYGQLAFQWSCHTQAEPGAPFVHREFLNVDASWPNERFARSLRDAIGDHGSVLVWSAFEKSVLNAVADELGALGSGDRDLANWLRRVGLKAGTENARQIDMLRLCREFYYHPAMGGSNSIKMVLDAVWKASPEVRARFAAHTGRDGDPERGPYAALAPEIIAGAEEEVAEGTGAMRAYFRMAYGYEKDDPHAVEKWSRLLREYCKLDTLAMVLIWEHWARITRA